MFYFSAEQAAEAAARSGFDWISLIPTAVVAAVISGIINIFWERRKLSRTEKANAYSEFLRATSKRWRAFGDRDGARKARDEAEVERLNEHLRSIRDEQWGAYALVQIVGSPDAAAKALTLIRAFDDRNKNFINPGSGRNIGGDQRTEMQNSFVAAARKDMGLRKLNSKKLKNGFQRSPRNNI